MEKLNENKAEPNENTAYCIKASGTLNGTAKMRT